MLGGSTIATGGGWAGSFISLLALATLAAYAAEGRSGTRDGRWSPLGLVGHELAALETIQQKIKAKYERGEIYLMVPVGEGQGLENLRSFASGMLIRKGGMGGLMRCVGLGCCAPGAAIGSSVLLSSSTRWNTILMLVLGKRSTHLK
jgi:hypothetical protein